MPQEYSMITAGAYAGIKRMKIHYLNYENDQVLCGAHLSVYETQPRDGVRLCKRCEAMFRRKGGTILEPVDMDIWLVDDSPEVEAHLHDATENIVIKKDGRLEQEVLGMWSIDSMYAPGAMEDTIIVFTPTGEGWLQYSNAFTDEVDHFNWEIDAHGLMQIDGASTDLVFQDLQVEITIETTPRGVNEVISFSQPIWLTECKFALVHRDFARMEGTKERRN
ncbi:hypothetical protein [Paenibacillus silvisoli]|uniref:hypothetical protein n=1 Tax=Paenibacillus silvisoli TaxID=3110539 RepID=UPI002804AAB5|nr:hypothetical protein [Paenibacillus silvisoli]